MRSPETGSKAYDDAQSADEASALPWFGILMPMPVFEYRCGSCGKKFSALVGMTAEPDDSKCPNCGSLETSKLVSRPGRFRTEDDRVEEVADRLDAMGEPSSPSEMREALREAGKALDDDLSDDIEEMFEDDSSDDDLE